MMFDVKLHGCSTFVIRDEENYLIGHNLDETFHVPGLVVFNPCGNNKRSYSLMEWITGMDAPTPHLTWEATYGSLSFNTFGRDLPDGGINEVGLYIQEMSLVGTQFPDYPERPHMFMVIWLQYVLDTCATVDEALATLNTLTLDGWTWHFFICDREGKYAVVEFPDGDTNIYTGDAVSVPVLCNTQYPEELENLKKYAAYGGVEIADIESKSIERFAQAAHMLDLHGQDPVDHAFDILEHLVRNGTQWTYVIDVNNGQVYFQTDKANRRKQVSLSAFSYDSDAPCKMIDIDADLQGDVTAHFEDYTFERNKELVIAQLENIDRDGGFSAAMEQFGNTKEKFINTMANYGE